jgi:hypothetical protein
MADDDRCAPDSKCRVGLEGNLDRYLQFGKDITFFLWRILKLWCIRARRLLRFSKVFAPKSDCRKETYPTDGFMKIKL